MPGFYLYNQNICTRLYLFGHDLKNLLIKNGWAETNLRRADFIFINSCSFLKKTEDFFLAKISELDKNKSAEQKIGYSLPRQVRRFDRLNLRLNR